MKVLIVESDADLGRLWQNHMERHGLDVQLVHGQSQAAYALVEHRFDVIVMNIVLAEGSALAVADLASYRHPDTQIIFVTGTSFFSDGSIFSLNANARAFLQADTPPEDLTAVVEHFGRAV
ncbi:response regulator [Roseovarius faecimaris]|uniref:Response regulator n=1 Tax=Roseovarius faecimaris TaxID=2494550 RepID=A0A6I6J3S5_9RHOB|nr:response regulator [Roseovarius faecimaris]QGX99428.1 response regulator [Roseovarius faecimaris]